MRAVAKSGQRNSCLQAIVAKILLQGQVRPMDPGPGSSPDTLSAIVAGFTLDAIEPGLHAILGHLQGLGPEQGAAPKSRGSPTHSRAPRLDESPHLTAGALGPDVQPKPLVESHAQLKPPRLAGSSAASSNPGTSKTRRSSMSAPSTATKTRKPS